MKKFGYASLAVLPAAVLSLAFVSGCNSEEPTATPKAGTTIVAPKTDAKSDVTPAPTTPVDAKK